MLLLLVLLPFMMLIVTALYWFTLVPCCPALACSQVRLSAPCDLKRNPFKRSRSSVQPKNQMTRRLQKSTRDGFIISNVLFVYIFFPSIIRAALETMVGEKICGEWYFSIDDTEPFYGARHRSFQGAVAIPALLAYAVVLPTLALVFLKLHKSILRTNRKMMFRFGLLFSGYSSSQWYWEAIVVLRKVALITIVTLAKNSLLQLHYAVY